MLHRINIVRTNVYFTDADDCSEEQYQMFIDAVEVLTTWIPIRARV